LPVLRAEGFVLKVMPLAEADRIVTFLTREEGKVRCVARSARKSRRRFGSSLEPWSRVSLSLFEKEGMDLARIDSCDLLESAYRLQEDLETAYLLAYVAEVTDMFARERQAEPHTFRLLTSLLTALKAGLPLTLAARYFETWTLRLHGLLADPALCGECGSTLAAKGARFQATSGRILCRRCLPRPAPSDLPLSGAALELLRTFVRSHPRELAGRAVDGAALSELGRMTSSSLVAYAEAPFRTARFLAGSEGVAR
jgi:DNA repair protein RecO (recombination protein O)